jgi:chromosome segregation ATPase
MKEQLVHKIESDRLKKQTTAVTERLETLERDMRDKQAIHEYATLIKGVAPQGGVDSQYLIKLQNQLAKAVKKMEGTTAKMTQIESSCDQVVNSLRSEIADIVEDRCRTELELRKQLQVLKEKTREMQAEYDDRIKENQKTLESLKTKAESVVPLEELEAEMDETYARLYELKRIHETQASTLEQLDSNLKSRKQQHPN